MVTRRGSDVAKVREIIDIVDVASGLQGQYRERKKEYELRRYPIEEICKNYTDYADYINPISPMTPSNPSSILDSNIADSDNTFRPIGKKLSIDDIDREFDLLFN